MKGFIFPGPEPRPPEVPSKTFMDCEIILKLETEKDSYTLASILEQLIPIHEKYPQAQVAFDCIDVQNNSYVEIFIEKEIQKSRRIYDKELQGYNILYKEYEQKKLEWEKAKAKFTEYNNKITLLNELHKAMDQNPEIITKIKELITKNYE